jgi:hypothetical protein
MAARMGAQDRVYDPKLVAVRTPGRAAPLTNSGSTHPTFHRRMSEMASSCRSWANAELFWTRNPLICAGGLTGWRAILIKRQVASIWDSVTAVEVTVFPKLSAPSNVTVKLVTAEPLPDLAANSRNAFPVGGKGCLQRNVTPDQGEAWRRRLAVPL